MDYNAFFAEVAAWTQQVNQAAARDGMASSEFWQWVTDSSAEISKKYNDNRLVIKQMIMLVEWLEEVYEGQAKQDVSNK